jgi:c-di-GMP-binding flagellar brake protein YcgR
MKETAMAENNPASMLRTSAEVAPVLRTLADGGVPVVSYLAGGEKVFESRVRHVDAAGGFIFIDAGKDAAAKSELLAQGRCIFHADVGGTRVEFVCAEPSEQAHAGKPAIRLRFPEVMSRWTRAHPRASVSHIPLQCVADSEGIMPFEGLIVDIGAEGVGFLIHEPNITLEPGTVLRSCLIEVPGKPPCKVDLEVCYSQPVTLGDGTRSLRSGCRFLDTKGPAKQVIDYYISAAA